MKFHKSLTLPALILLASSCALPKYMHVYNSSKSLDLRYGGWIVNYASGNTPEYLKISTEKKVIDEFKKMGVDTIFSLRELILDYVSPELFSNNLSPETLDLLHQTTDFSYILSIETLKVKDELSGFMISAPDQNCQNISEVILKAYDIKNKKLIYHHRVTGQVSIDDNYTEYTLTKSANGLVSGAVKQALKNIKKYSVTKDQTAAGK